ncbi:uncharacterized protein TRAVEDRAFT_69167 [Trametes versicolor FP-101664 SS1]|uniref:uncharacterized protein n=1 Tax=Trametes versicolor (strain FP-101664) TaxID=717944 RepID=UPI0004624081|nr:uncharacterized protein TRAVEDRAFT_69167 [Trametes versicolor FP-101664 SS1]EIW63001.1 hypothetical protein TRAVEDRAFT_69167 [Trametes versicolor FP-101664 SS1]
MRLTLDASTEAFLGDGFAVLPPDHLNLARPNLDAFFAPSIEMSNNTHSTLEYRSKHVYFFWRTLFGAAVLVTMPVFVTIICKGIRMSRDSAREKKAAEQQRQRIRAQVRQAAQYALCRTDSPFSAAREERFRTSIAHLFSPASIEDLIWECAPQPPVTYVPSTPSASTPVVFVETGAAVEHLRVSDYNRSRSTQPTKVEVDVAEERHGSTTMEECLPVEALFNAVIDDPVESTFQDPDTTHNANVTLTPLSVAKEFPCTTTTLDPTTTEPHAAADEEPPLPDFREGQRRLRAFLLKEGYYLSPARPSANLHQRDHAGNKCTPGVPSRNSPTFTSPTPTAHNNTEQDWGSDSEDFDLSFELLKPTLPAAKAAFKVLDAPAQQHSSPLDTSHPELVHSTSGFAFDTTGITSSTPARDRILDRRNRIHTPTETTRSDGDRTENVGIASPEWNSQDTTPSFTRRRAPQPSSSLDTSHLASGSARTTSRLKFETTELIASSPARDRMIALLSRFPTPAKSTRLDKGKGRAVEEAPPSPKDARAQTPSDALPDSDPFPSRTRLIELINRAKAQQSMRSGGVVGKSLAVGEG